MDVDTATHDLVVIGGGPGGYVAALRAAQLGLRVGLVESEALLGGVCLRVGCIPSKVLLEISERYAEAKADLPALGIRAREVELDLAAVMRRKDEVVKTLARGVDALVSKRRVTRYRGLGRLDGPGRVAVEPVEGRGAPARLRATHVLLAPGSRPIAPPGVALDGDRIVASAGALAFPEVPSRLLVIGAGYIGLELGSVWHRFGSAVTVVDLLDRILPGLDGETAAEALAIYRKQGLDIRLGCRLRAAGVTGGACVVELEGAEPLRADRVLVAVGRAPAVDGLGLETVGIKPDAKGRIPVDARFAAAPGVYAVGDAIGGILLAHKASEEGVACVEGIVAGYGHVDYGVIPGIVYTHPEVASVGRTEEELRQAGTAYRKGTFPFSANGRARTLGDPVGRVKILADATTDRVLGVHVIGPRAGDLIAEAAAAMAFGASSEDLARVCHAHPTLSEALREAALAVDGRAIHA